MTKQFERANKILAREFGKNRKMYLATSFDEVPSVRIVNTFYWNRSFYIVTHETSEIVQQIIKNKNVSICATASNHKFQGEAINIGHPLKEENKEIRDILTNAFSSGYFEQYDESDPKICYVQVKVNEAFTYANKIGYKVDFRTDEVRSFPFAQN